MPATVTRSEVQKRFQDKSIDLAAANAKGVPVEARAGLSKADKNGDGRLSGKAEIDAAFKALDRFDRNGSAHSLLTSSRSGPTVAGKALAALESVAFDAAADRVRPGLGSQRPAQPAPSSTTAPPAAGDLSSRFTPSSTALTRAAGTDLGRTVAARTEQNRALYEKAGKLTGVPPALIAAIHANESGMGTNRSSVKGPESGFGLDPGGVSTSWGNQVLKKHGLGTWQRGRDNPTASLQAAVIAGEHLKRMGAYAGVDVGPNMNAKDLAGAIGAYTTGIRAGKRAAQTGKTWMFDPSDKNPLPNHPGGTSVGPGGRRIRVNGGRKPGLLRWDVLIPLVERQLRSSTGNA